MYAFKVMVTTLIAVLMIAVLCAGLGVKGSKIKITALIIFCVQALGIVAIWG